MENRIYVSLPLDALIVSGITSDCAVQISAMDGAILIERCDDDCKEGCSEFSEKEEELQSLLKSVSESDSNTTMCCRLRSLMTAR